MAREAAVCLAKPVEAVSLGSLEELSSYVKVLWGHQVAVTAHKGAFGVVMFQCALRWGSSALCQTFHDKAGCAKQRPFSPFLHTGGSRGLVHGRLWRRDGVLAVTCAQEGVIRLKPQVSASKL